MKTKELEKSKAKVNKQRKKNERKKEKCITK